MRKKVVHLLHDLQIHDVKKNIPIVLTSLHYGAPVPPGQRLGGGDSRHEGQTSQFTTSTVCLGTQTEQVLCSIDLN